MTITELNEEIKLAIKKGVFHPRLGKEEVIISLWGGELILHSLEPHGAGKWYYSDTSGG